MTTPISGKKNFEFLHQETFLSHFKQRFRRKFFEKLVQNSSNLFLRGKDIISIDPQIRGIHEPVITKLIEHFSTIGYGNFLIDIGANIGLTSCQSGKHFKKIHLFEPNPLCCKILEVNCVIALQKIQYEIHHFALGNENKKSILNIPLHNWGGAFIKDSVNSYSTDLLANKDNFTSFSESNYYCVDIEIRKTEEVFSQIFKKLTEENLLQGVIKIDVEGYEPVVLQGIAAAIPPQFKLFIIFESWNANFDMQAVVKAFCGKAAPYKLVRHTPWNIRSSKILSVLSCFLLNRKIISQIETNAEGDWKGDLILQIN